MNDEFDKPLYSIGYKKPPKGSQFKPGESGNRNGRPKGSLNFATDIDRELATRVTVKENGSNKQVTKKRIIAKQIVNKAAGGDLKASAMLLNQAYLNEQTLQAKGIALPKVLIAEDQMVMASIAKRIRESFPLEPLKIDESLETELTPSPVMTLESYLYSITSEGEQS